MSINKKVLASKIEADKSDAYEYQHRRHNQWRMNYILYRDTVIVDRVFQRQTANIPMTKATIKTIMAAIGKMIEFDFVNRDNNKDKELVFNAYWDDVLEDNIASLKDIVDKKQLLLKGRSFKFWYIKDGKPRMKVFDAYDILVDRLADPTDIDSARFIIQQHIFTTLGKILSNPAYDAGAKAKLREFFESQEGGVVSEENQESLMFKNQRLKDLGVMNTEDFATGETIVELNNVYYKLWDEEEKAEKIYFIVYAHNQVLQVTPLEDIYGKTPDRFWRDHYPFEWVADDVEVTDVWSDGVADIVRGSNIAVNALFSQMMENRTLRNYNMYFYNSSLSKERFAPQTFTPRPWGWYPVPGNPNEVIQQVQIPNLEDSINDIRFIMDVVGKATAVTDTQQGDINNRKVTLGEVQMAFTQSLKRIDSITPFLKTSWKLFANKFVKMIEGSHHLLDDRKLYKKGYRGTVFNKKISGKDLVSESMFDVEVVSVGDRQAKAIDVLKKLDLASAKMPENQALKKVYADKILSFIDDLTPEERDQINQAQEMQPQVQMPVQNQPINLQPQAQGVNPAVMQGQ